jgi:hypothetical protein
MKDRQNFIDQLIHEIKLYRKKYKRLAVRLNVYSDLPWESICPDLFELDVQFYDYTKRDRRYAQFLRGDFPERYDLTFSRSERNDELCLDFLGRGGRIAVVTRDEYWRGYPVKWGNDSDLRFLDSPGVIGLTPKGKLKKSNSTFISVDSLKGVGYAS